MTKPIDVKLNETYRLPEPDGRLVRCVASKGRMCEDCEFGSDDDSCGSGQHLTCIPEEREDGEFCHFVLVEEPEEFKEVSLPVCNVSNPGTFGGPSPPTGTAEATAMAVDITRGVQAEKSVVPAPQSAAERIREFVKSSDPGTVSTSLPPATFQRCDAKHQLCGSIRAFIDSLPSEPEEKVKNAAELRKQLAVAEARLIGTGGFLNDQEDTIDTLKKQLADAEARHVPHRVAQLEVQIHNLKTGNKQLVKQLETEREQRKAVIDDALVAEVELLRKQLADAPAPPVGSISITEHTAEVARVVARVRAKCNVEFDGKLREKETEARLYADLRAILGDCVACLPCGETWAATNDGVLQYVRDIVAWVNATESRVEAVTASEKSLMKVNRQLVADCRQAGEVCATKFAAMVRELRAEFKRFGFENLSVTIKGLNQLLAKLEPAGMNHHEALLAVAVEGKRMMRQGKKWYVFLRGGIVMVHCSDGSVFEYIIVDDDIDATDWVEVESEASDE